MARRKQRTNWKIDMSHELLERVAPIVLGDLAELVSGYRLLPSSSIWKNSKGMMTARLAFRTDRGTSMTFTVREIAPAMLQEGAHG